MKDPNNYYADSILYKTVKVSHRLALPGDGLSREAISEADYVVRIPMKNNVDSLNVAAAAAVAFWELWRR